MKVRNLVILGSVGSILAACAGNPSIKNTVYSSADRELQRSNEARATIVPVQPNQPSLVEVDKGIYIPPKSIPITSDLNLPDVFNRQITAIFPGQTNVSTVAERISKVTGIPVKIKPDVYLRATSLIVGGGAAPQASNDSVNGAAGANGGQGGGAANGALQGGGLYQRPIPGYPINGVPGQVGYGAGLGLPTNNQSYSETFELNYTGSVSGLLDRLSSRLGISWEYKNGQIELFRLETKSFVLKANPGSTEFGSSLGKSGGSTTSGDSGGFTSTSKVTMESNFSIWSSVESAVRSMLSVSGKLSVSQATGTITVTDTRQVVESVKEYIDQQNAILTRMVSIKVEVLNVTLTDEDEFGLDWNLLYQQLNAAGQAKWSFGLATPSTLTSAQAGSFGFNILAPVGQGLGQYNGSSAIYRALATMGRTSVVTTSSATTLNRQPVPVAITKQTAYLAQTTPAVSSVNGVAGTPGLTPGTVTTGFLLNFLPTVEDNNAVFLQFSLDISQLTNLGTFSVGSGATQQAIQTPEVSGTQFLQRVSLRPGETLVISGFDQSYGQYDQRTLGRNTEPGFGGSRTGKNDRNVLVILITPVVRSGA